MTGSLRSTRGSMTLSLTESASVQCPLKRYAEQLGWHLIQSAEAVSLRRGEGGTYFDRILEEKLIELNPGLISPENARAVVHRIESVPSTIEGNREILSWLRGEQTVFDSAERRERNVRVIDFQHPDRNVFHVTDEWQYTNGQETNRADVMFLINGLPVAVVETKSPLRRHGIEEGFVQIRRYHSETPEMMTMPQVFDVTHLVDFFYGVTWNLDRKNLFNWRTEEDDNFEEKVKAFFDPERFLEMLGEWILFFYKEDELQKAVLRQHQTRAVGKILGRCADDRLRTGLVWHTQGSGKTFTMISAARLILQGTDTFGRATVILMIDRNELEGQLSGWVDRLLGEGGGIGIPIEHATSKARLRELLDSDFRGLVISMIHKFDGVRKDINARENIFVLVDEAHRTTGGDLGNYLFGALPNATLIGFTGTPIDRTAYGKGTFKTFGREDDRGYLDKYSIAESIADGTTVPLKYTLAPGEIRVPREQLEEEFLDLAQAEGISDVEDLNRILDRAMRLKTFLKANDRIDKVAAFVAEHYQNNVEPMGYKALLVAVDREACALYKEALDRVLPSEYSLPIYSSSLNDSERLPLVHRHQVMSDGERLARKQFRRPDGLPKILIVTDKLLTGFDAPILYAMYLDKPMRDHVLLQAIARVNRPYERGAHSRKPCGLVLDFVGIFEKLEKALAFDSDVVTGVIEDLDLMLEAFRETMAGPAQEYLELCRGPSDDKAIERILDVFSDPDRRRSFFELYRRLEGFYEILSPSPDLREFIEDFGCLSMLHKILRSSFERKYTHYGEIARKTEMLVRERVESYGLEGTLQVVRIDQDTLDAIKATDQAENTRIVNLVKSIERTVSEDEGSLPHLRPIGERAESIMDAYERRQETTEEALAQLLELAEEIVEAQRIQREMGVDQTTFSLYWLLRSDGVPQPEKTASALRDVFERFPYHRENAAEMRELKAELYRALLPVVGKDKMIRVVRKLLQSGEKA